MDADDGSEMKVEFVGVVGDPVEPVDPNGADDGAGDGGGIVDVTVAVSVCAVVDVTVGGVFVFVSPFVFLSGFVFEVSLDVRRAESGKILDQTSLDFKSIAVQVLGVPDDDGLFA